MKVFTAEYLNGLTTQAQANQRKRQHRNIHESYEEPCQRLFNAIEPDSYIRPHRHSNDPKDELLIAIRGLMALVTFNNLGDVTASLCFGSEKYGSELAVGVEVAVNTWHTVIALEPGCILLEVKNGPFEPNSAKEYAPWAPEEGSPDTEAYLKRLVERVTGFAR
jgi:cupin fold WbuC family metalloprotein